MRTAVIWHFNKTTSYAVINGDLRCYNGLLTLVDYDVLQAKDKIGDKMQELINLSQSWSFVSKEQFDQAVNEGAYSIECGFKHSTCKHVFNRFIADKHPAIAAVDNLLTDFRDLMAEITRTNESMFGTAEFNDMISRFQSTRKTLMMIKERLNKKGF